MIEAHDLTKKYDDLYALRGLELDLKAGDLFGFIGPNGAGKTTTMRILATLLEPTWGEAYVCGFPVQTKPRDVRRVVGYMPDFFGVYDDMTVIEYLEFFAAAYRIGGAARRKRCEEMLELVDLGFKREAFASTLSRGQTQRLGLARVLLHDPQVLLLDEPLSGLDPRARIGMRNLLKQLRDMGKTLIVSSHILPELADICNKVGVIDRGVMSINAAVADVRKLVREKTVLFVGVAGDPAAAVGVLAQQPSVESAAAENGHIVVTLTKGATEYSHLPAALVAAGQRITLFREEEISLEAAFMALTKGMGQK